jgi:serpin B
MLSDRGALITPAYRELLRKVYTAEVFENVTVEYINAWVSRKTQEEIPKILAKLADDSVAVLLSTIFLKAGFVKSFERRLTADADFYVSPEKIIKAPTMHRTDSLPMAQGSGYRVVCLSFTEPNLGIYVVLPNDKNGLAEVSDRLDFGQQAQLMRMLATAESVKDVDLALPRFKLGYEADLVGPFRQAGLRLAFANNADFSGATGVPGSIKIGDILHRASLELAEDGIKAAAVTAVEWHLTSGRITIPPVKVEPFIVDRPFLFFIADQATGAVLFEGRVMDPTKTA